MTFLQPGNNQEIFEDKNLKDMYPQYKEHFFVASSEAMREVSYKLDQYAGRKHPVLIIGPGGSGRHATALELHKRGIQKGPQSYFRHFSCIGLSEKITDGILFGEDSHKGLLFLGPKYTLFIKGLDKWSLEFQRKFLDIYNKEMDKDTLSRIVLSADKSAFVEEEKKSWISQELLSILKPYVISLPNLSDRKSDIEILMQAFLKRNDFEGRLSSDALKMLQNHNWLGNLTTLRNVCYKISILCSDKKVLKKEDLINTLNFVDGKELSEMVYDPKLSLDQYINQCIQQSLDHFKSKKESAKALGISVKTIYNKIKSGAVVFTD